MFSRSTALVVLLFAAPALAQSEATPQAPAPTPAPPPSTLELPPPPEAATPPSGDSGEINLEDWNRNDWSLIEPKTVLFELNGYLRLRADALRKLDFDNGISADPAVSARYPAWSEGHASYTGANMRLRLEPIINVSENIHIVTTFDILDNLVMGSTPAAADSDGVPLNLVARGQRLAVGGATTLSDSIVVRRAYARLTALNEQLELRFGRMPSHFGLGVLANDGDCLDCDYGDTVDRVSVAFKIADHVFVPMFDWASSGPVIQPFESAQPVDAITKDDVEQYSVQVLRVDGEDDIRDRVLAGDTVLNYGAWGIWRRQLTDVARGSYAELGDGNLAADQTPDDADPLVLRSERRDANVFTGDAYLKLHVGQLELGAEAALVLGSFRMVDDDLVGRSNSIYQLGGALELDYHLSGDYQGATLSLRTGGASGDSAPGFGALDRTATQRSATDTKLNNFQFSPDYHVDLLLFRHIIGTVTDAWYVRPGVAYAFDNNVGGKLGVVYSQAMFSRSTPGYNFGSASGSKPLGLELDAELNYGIDANQNGGALKAAIMGGMLFPFGAWKNLDRVTSTADGAASFAWTLQARAYITF